MSWPPSRRHWSATALAVVLALCAGPAEGDDGPAAEEISRRAGELLSDPGYQTSLPDGPASTGRSGSGFSGAAGPQSGSGGSGGGTSRPRSTGSGSRSLDLAGGAVITTFLWVLVAAVVAVAVIWLAREAAASRLRRARIDEAPELPETAAPSRPPAEDEIEALVRRGEYGEAAHLLLRRTIALLGRRRPLAESLTSREVARTAQLTETEKGAFQVLVASVERFLFGGVALPREDYDRCAEAYRVVTGATVVAAPAAGAPTAAAPAGDGR